MTLTAAMLCLALNVYHEARGEPLAGQHAVAQVTMNRAGRDPDKLCDVVFEPKQFSWANPLTRARGAERARLASKYVPKPGKEWDRAKRIAYDTASGLVTDFTGGANFFHARYVNPAWRHQFKFVATIGQHSFYRGS